MKVCQSCGKEIKGGDQAVEVRYGKMGTTAHPHWKVFPNEIDYFHAYCDKAFREK